MKINLPDFQEPPVIETVIGVEFDHLPNWQIPHFGLFWKEIRSEYNLLSQQPPLKSEVEKFDGFQAPIASLRIGPPEIRCLFHNSNQEWLIQIQNNRFLSNWVKKDENYPRYTKTLERFELYWGKFADFLSTESIPTPKIQQCEVTYTNHIEGNVTELNDIFSSWAGSSNSDFLPTPEGASISTSYRIPDKRGRLHISVQPVFRHSDAKIVVSLSLTARVIPENEEKVKMMEAINLGREWVVRGFADITTDRMHQIWGRRII